MKCLLALFALLPSVAFAYQGVIDPPNLVEGQHVYSIPEGYQPPEMRASDLEAMQGKLANLHYPAYVVLIENVPPMNDQHRAWARQEGFRTSGDQLLIEVTTAKLPEDWAAEYDWYNFQQASVFVLAANPRQFAFQQAPAWKNDLGVGPSQMDGHTKLFLDAVRGTPKDPATGITKAMASLDTFAFDRTDPVRVAELRAQEEQRKAQHRLNRARGDLDEQILRMEGLLASKDRFLPEDVRSYSDSLKDAKDVRSADQAENMAATAEKMRGSADILEQYVRAQKAEYQGAVLAHVILWLLIACGIGAVWFLLWRRYRTLVRLGDQYRETAAGWVAKVDNASARYVDAYMERDDIIELDECSGETEALWKEVTHGVDSIWYAVQGLRKHVLACHEMAKKASMFNLAPLTQALLDLDEPFDFDTGQINREELFGGETVTIRVRPAEFVDELQERFKANRDGWQILKDAASARNRLAQAAMPHTAMDALFERAGEFDLPHEWLSDHPLYGDDESDAAFYEVLNKLRAEDPVAYLRRLVKEEDRHTAIQNRLDSIIGCVKAVRDARVTDIPDFQNTVLGSDDDPSVTLAAAREAEHELAGAVASEARTKDTAKVAHCAEIAARLYDKVKYQVGVIESAIAGAENAVHLAVNHQADMAKARQAAEKRADTAPGIHQEVQAAYDNIKAGMTIHKSADNALGRARKALEQRKHVEARREAERASQGYKGAQARFQTAIDYCNKLDEAKARFEQKLARMEASRNDAIRTVRQYDGNAGGVGTFRPPRVEHPCNYTALFRDLERQEEQWRAHARKVQREYEEAEARKRAEEERRRREKRRREEEEERRRRRSTYNSYGGHSSGGFGGGGFSGSSGGW